MERKREMEETGRPFLPFRQKYVLSAMAIGVYLYFLSDCLFYSFPIHILKHKWHWLKVCISE
jgi:hypothetical protein